MSTNAEKYYGNYLGIVVQNNDPKKQGRVKIYIPHISVVVNDYAKLDDNIEANNRSFRFPGSNIAGDLTKSSIDLIKNELDWSTCAAPLVGESSSGRYNAFKDTASISDTNKIETFTPITADDNNDTDDTEDASDSVTDTNLNVDNIGESPGRKYELQKLKLYDAFSGPIEGSHETPNRANIFSYNYTPNTYSNKSKGSFSIPAVGAHVWCFFENGDITNAPVYFAVSHGSEDWKGIYDSHDEEGIDYPGTFENKSTTDDDDYNNNTETYRNKYVINQKGGVLEFCNSDQRELLKMTHYSGSFKEFNNHANIELASANDQKLVLEDQFLTVRGYGNYYVERDSDNLIKGDHYIKVGKLDANLHREWRELASEMAQVKQLFEIQRTNNLHAAESNNGKDVIYRRCSPLQKKAGSHARCPVCQTNEAFGDFYHDVNNEFVSVKVPKDGGHIIKDGTTHNLDDIVNSVVEGETYGQQGDKKAEIFGTSCPVCGGGGVSPSSMNGSFSPDPLKETKGNGKGTFEKKIIDTVNILKDVERKMGRGGSQIIDIAKHKVETIGLAMNDFGSIRVDPYGKMYRDSVIVHPEGTFNSQAASPLVEYVHVDDLPGGTYTLNVCNKWNVQVGAGGVSMKSYGPVDIGGSIVNMAGEQVNVTSQNEVNIDGGKRLTLVADILTIRQRNRKQVLIDSNLGVSQNVVIGGGLHVDGELSVNHITAPCEIQETEMARVFGKLIKGLSFNARISGINAWTTVGAPDGEHKLPSSLSNVKVTLKNDSDANIVQCYDHSHSFKNVPLHLKKKNKDVRDVGMKCNDEKRAAAAPIERKRASEKVTP
jgi:hypothetical protein